VIAKLWNITIEDMTSSSIGAKRGRRGSLEMMLSINLSCVPGGRRAAVPTDIPARMGKATKATDDRPCSFSFWPSAHPGATKQTVSIMGTSAQGDGDARSVTSELSLMDLVVVDPFLEDDASSEEVDGPASPTGSSDSNVSSSSSDTDTHEMQSFTFWGQPAPSTAEASSMGVLAAAAAAAAASMDEDDKLELA